MSEELTYAERVQKLRTSLDKATARKEEKEETRKNLIKEFDDLKKKCKDLFDCNIDELAKKIVEKELQLEKLISDSEEKLKTVTDNLNSGKDS